MSVPEPLRAALERLFGAAVDAVAPEALVRRHLHREGAGLVVTGAAGEVLARMRVPAPVIGAGKAAARLAKGCEDAAGPGATRGVVIVADGCGAELRDIRWLEAGHPLPDRRGLKATAALLRFAAQLAEEDSIVWLLSGGASSLLVRPVPPVTPEDASAVYERLLASGAAIDEINAVRKHLSQVAGGGLLRHCRGLVIGLLLSDVVGDDPAVIGSGPTVPDPTTFADAMAVLERHGLTEAVPRSVRTVLAAGVEGRLPETLKPGDPLARRAVNLVIGSNDVALSGAAAAAAEAGWLVTCEQTPIAGDTRQAAERFAQRLRAEAAASRGDGRRRCLVAGGETTVRVLGRGTGGRNQEFALAVARAIAGVPVAVLSAGSDGIDGPTDVAGAFVDGHTLERARRLGLDPDAALAENDSYPFFAALGDHFRPGPTGTNVMDLKLALIEPATWPPPAAAW